MAFIVKSNVTVSNLRVGPVPPTTPTVPILETNLLGFWDIGSATSFDGSSNTITNIASAGLGYNVNSNSAIQNQYVSQGESSYLNQNGGNSATLGVQNWNLVDNTPMTLSVFMWIKRITGGTNYNNTIFEISNINTGVSQYGSNWSSTFQLVDRGTNTNDINAFLIYNGGSQSFVDKSTSLRSSHPNQWVNIGFTLSSGSYRLYKNGSLEATGTLASLSFDDNGSRLLQIGPQYPPNQYHWANTAYYNAVLTDAEVLSNFDALKSRYGY